MKPAPPADGLRYFIASSLVLVFSYGVAVGMFEIFPHGIIKQAIKGLSQLNGGNFIEYYHSARDASWEPIVNTDQACDGVNLVTRIDGDDRLVAEIIDLDGSSIHRWDIDWFAIWPDATHLPSEVQPRSAPGCQIHGAALMPNGDVVFNFDYLGLVRIDRAGSVVWRLPYQTHHSIHVHDDGNLWVCGQRRRDDRETVFPYRKPLWDESTILEVSPAGEILNEWSIEDILRKNDRAGLLGLSRGFVNGYAQQDILHMNDVELFPASMEEGFFEHDDILISLRNISTIFVMERDTLRIKFISTGQMIWQHDPDFVDGDRIAVFDNRGGATDGYAPASRILMFDMASSLNPIFSRNDNASPFSSVGLAPLPLSGALRSLPSQGGPRGRFDSTNLPAQVVFEGDAATPFYTDIMGKHQWLPNGNVLITESTAGRAFEINANGEIVWQYINFVGEGVVGIVQEVTRLPAKTKQLFGRPAGGVVQHMPSVDIKKG